MQRNVLAGGVIVSAIALLISGTTRAADDPASQIASICSSESMASDPALASQCKEARTAAIGISIDAMRTAAAAAAQATAAAAQTNLSTQRQAELAADKTRVETIKAAMAVDANALAAIAPDAILKANAQTYTGKYLLSDAAKRAAQRHAKGIAAAAVSAAAEAANCQSGISLVLADGLLPVTFANYSTAHDAITALDEEAASIGSPTSTSAAGPGREGLKGLEFKPYGLTGAILGVDLLTKTAALIASFRPQFAFESTPDNDFEAMLRAYLKSQLSTELGASAKLVSVGDALPQIDRQAKPLARSVRGRLEALGKRVNALAASYGASAGSGEQRTRMTALLKEAENLKGRLLLSQTDASGKPTEPPLMQSFDQIDAAQLTQGCTAILHLRLIAAGSDASTKQAAFGSQINRQLVYGSMSWQVNDPAGRVSGSGVVETRAEWTKHGDDLALSD